MEVKFGITAPLSAIAVLSACSTTGDLEGANPQPTLPEAVAALAAPYQDLSSARLLSDDGCYWYSHVGPVETTLLPLRTVNGNPICTKSQSAQTG